MASSKEVNAYYTSCKIKINPTSYSLKDRVVIHNARSNSMPSRISKYKEIEYSLLSAINKYFQDTLKRDFILESFKPLTTSMYMNFKQNTIVDLGLFINNLHLNTVCWNKLTTSFNVKKLAPVDKAIIYYLTALLNSENNILKYIVFTNLQGTEHFKDVKDMKFLTDNVTQLISGKADSLTIVNPCIFHVECNLNDILPKGSAYEGCSLEDIFVTNVQYLAEAFYILEHITDKDVKDNIYTLIRKDDFHPIYRANLDGSLSYASYIEDIINTENEAERYSKIKNLESNTELKDNIQTYLKSSTTKWKALPFFLSLISGFAQNICAYYVRTTTIQILLKLCRYYKIKIFEGMTGSSLDRSLTALKDLGGLDDETDKKPSMLSNKGSIYADLDDDDSSKPDKDKSKPISEPTVDFLDAQYSTFSESGYAFQVSDDIYKLTDVDTDSKIQYDIITSKVKLLNKNLIRKIKEIKVYNTGGKNSGMSKGKLDRKALYKYKTTDKIFYNNTYKVKESDLAFGIVLDVSGSMHGKGIENGVTTMVVLHETLKALNINHSIITHESVGMYQCNIVKYHYFKEDKYYNVSKNYNLMNIKAMRGNCDSAALYYMEKAMSRVQNKDKIVMMFSDGEPTECTGDDLKKQVRHMERKGIKVIGIGINYPSIAEYYSDYANGANLKEMLDIVSNILKQYILEKKE